jgi:riboflavin kinase / FMN adenylyltransferase
LLQVKIHHTFNEFQQISKPIVTIGTFDGVHLGHRTILEKIKSLAQQVGGESVLLTFYPHPRMVLYPNDHGLQLLSSPEEKWHLLKQAGLDHVMIYPFTPAFSRLSAYDYVHDLLANGLHTHTLVIGYDHRFGRDREGNHDTLVELSKIFGFDLLEIPAHHIDQAEISSTKIRESLKAGDVVRANKLLGHPYTIHGQVVAGDGRGRSIGFPTANILPSFTHKLIPAKGVYAAKITVEQKTHHAVVNIGVRPTFTEQNIEKIEAYLIDFAGDLYNKTVRLELITRLRNEQKFGSIVELTAQIESDIRQAKSYF